MKKFIFTIFFVLLAFKSSLAYGAEDLKAVCLKKVPSPNVTITVKFGDLKYDHSKGKRAIYRLHIASGGSIKNNNLLNGLSVFKRKISVGLLLSRKTLPSGINCYYPTDVNFVVGTGDDPVIYIAREIKKDTCDYNVVLRHEQTHQQINYAVFEHHLPKIKEYLIDVVKKYPVAATRKNVDINKASSELSKKYTEDAVLIIEEVKKETQKEQEKLDTTENYTYEDELCI